MMAQPDCICRTFARMRSGHGSQGITRYSTRPSSDPSVHAFGLSLFALGNQGLQEEIKLIPMDMAEKPGWYKKVYPNNQVPSLEHNKKIMGESLDVIKYIDSNFDGPKLITNDPEKQRFAEELLGYSDAFNRALLDALRSEGPMTAEAVAALDKIDSSLLKFDDGPFFLGQLSLVDIAYAPFIEGFQIFFAGIKNCDITEGRVHIHKFIEEMNKIDAYTQTKQDPQVLLALTKKKFGV